MSEEKKRRQIRIPDRMYEKFAVFCDLHHYDVAERVRELIRGDLTAHKDEIEAEMERRQKEGDAQP